MATEQPIRVLTRCDGHQLRAIVETATAWLLAHAHEVDALNVYPVPDGDTGSNMSQTMQAAADEASMIADEHHAGIYAARMAHGALMGARGNSGVILSQILRGFAHTLDGQRTFTPPQLAAALHEASTTAYRAVMKPVEGTVLTVARVAADHAIQAAAEQPEFLHVLSSAVSAGRRALAETRNQLPALRQAGVVDAGGRGYLLLLEGALRHLQGNRETGEARQAAGPAASRAAAVVHAQFDHTEGGYGYCTEFMIIGTDLREEEVRQTLSEYGDSLLVVGEAEILRVHIHTEDPGRALTYASSLGRLRRVKIQDMQEQHEEFAGETTLGGEEPVRSEATPAGDALPIGVVAAVTGAGFTELYQSLGALVVPGGQTMNPSTEQILSAINACPQDSVIVLPNNKNVILTAEQAAGLSAKTVHVLPTATVPQGIAALLAIRYDEEIPEILTTMQEAAANVRTAELTTAVRDVEMNGLQVNKGDVLGLLDGSVVAAGRDVSSVLGDLLVRMPADRYEVVTVYTGADATTEETQVILDLLKRRYPELQVEQHNGGQPHYPFVLSVE